MKKRKRTKLMMPQMTTSLSFFLFILYDNGGSYELFVINNWNFMPLLHLYFSICNLKFSSIVYLCMLIYARLDHPCPPI